MPNNSIDLRATLNTDDVSGGAKKANAAFDSMGNAAKKSSDKVNSGFSTAAKAASGLENSVKNLYRTIASVAGLHILRDLVKEFLNIVVSFERSRIAFKAFIGDAQIAEKVLQDIKTFATKSPVDLDTLMQGGSLLLALGTSSQNVLPYLKAVSAAVGAIGGTDAEARMTNIIQDIEKIGARGHVTGEVLRNLGRNGINATQYLAEGFQTSKEKIDELVEKGALPAAQAIDILFKGMQQQFGRFAAESEDSIGTALSNIRDQIKSTVDTISLAYQPQIKAFIQELNAYIKSSGEFLVAHQEFVGDAVTAIESLVAAWLALKAAIGIVEIVKLVKELGPLVGLIGEIGAEILVAFGNPVVIAIAAVAAAILAVAKAFEEADAAAKTYAGNLGRWTPKRTMFPGDGQKNEPPKDNPTVDWTKGLITPPKVLTVAEIEAQDEARRLAKEAATEAKRAFDAANKAADAYFDKATLKAEDSVFGRLVEEYHQLEEVLTKGDAAHKLKALQGLNLNIQTEAQKMQKKMNEDFLEEETELFSKHLDARSDKLQQSLEQQADLLKLHMETRREMYRIEVDPSVARDSDLRALNMLPHETPEQKIAIEQQKLEIEKVYLEKSLEMNKLFNKWEMESELNAYGLTQEMKDAIRASHDVKEQVLSKEYADEVVKLEEDTAAEIKEIRTKASIEAADKAIAEQTRIFNSFKSQAGKIIDALVSKDRWKGLGNALKVTVLTAMKDILSSQIAIMFMRLMGFNTGVRAPSGASFLGNLLGSLGFGSIPIFGNKSVTGGPGGTGPYTPGSQTTGPGSDPITQAASVAGLAKATGLAGWLGTHLGSAAGLGAAAIGGGALGMMGAWKLGQSDSKLGKALAIPTGAAAGALAGSGLVAMFPALLAAGPAGWLVGAGIGAAIGIMSLMKDSAITNVQKEIEKTYKFKVERSFVKNAIMPIIKDKYGGDIGVGVRSPEVREMVKLYAMSRGLNTSGIVAEATPSVFASRGGSFQQMPTFQNGQALYPTVTTGNEFGSSVTFQLDGPATTKLLQGEAVEAVASNPRVVSRSAEEGQSERVTRASSIPLLGPNYILA